MKAIAVDEGAQDATEHSEAQPKNGSASPDEDGDRARVAAPREGSKQAMVIALCGAPTARPSSTEPRLRDGCLTRRARRSPGCASEGMPRSATGSAAEIQSTGSADALTWTGDRIVGQRDAMDGRGPKHKAVQAAKSA